MYYSANYPDILISNMDTNPELSSPNAGYSISFAFTKEQRYDYEEYQKMVDAAIRNFRSSQFYKHYKGYLYAIGLDRCQFHPYIQNNEEYEMASLEMHHCMLNIYDIAILITEHMLETVGCITEFDLSDLLKVEHANNNVPIVMLCKTCHQMYHHKYLYVHPTQVFGQWWNLLTKYEKGVTREMADKLLRYLNRGIADKAKYRDEDIKRLLALRDEISDFSGSRGVLLDGCPNPYGTEGFVN